MKALKLTGIVGGSILLMILILIAAAPKVAEYVAFKGFSPAERKKMQAQYEAWRGKKLAIPPAALDVKPFSAEAQATAKAFETAWAAQRADAMKLKEVAEKSKGEPGAAELKALAPQFPRVAPLMDAFTAMVQRPDYTMVDFGAAQLHRDGGIPMADPIAIGACLRVLQLRAQAALQEGRMDDALADTELIFRAAKSGPYDFMLAQSLGMSFTRLAITIQQNVLRQTQDAATLRRMREIQDRVPAAMTFFSDKTVPPEIIDRLGVLREIKRRGVTIDVRNVTAQELLGKTMEAQALYLQTKVLPAVTGDWALAEKVRSYITSYRQGAGQVGGAAYRQAGFMTRLFSNISAPTTFRMITPVYGKLYQSADDVRADFEALRRETARKLEESRPGAPRPAPAPAPANLNTSK